jgi:hypothetical protein
MSFVSSSIHFHVSDVKLGEREKEESMKKLLSLLKRQNLFELECHYLYICMCVCTLKQTVSTRRGFRPEKIPSYFTFMVYLNCNKSAILDLFYFFISTTFQPFCIKSWKPSIWCIYVYLTTTTNDGGGGGDVAVARYDDKWRQWRQEWKSKYLSDAHSNVVAGVRAAFCGIAYFVMCKFSSIWGNSWIYW